jgi:hypothetical protein
MGFLTSFARGRLLVVGLILTFAGGGVLKSTISRQMNGVEATATVLEHISECSVEYRLVVADHNTEEPMACDAAVAFQNSMGSNKVTLLRNDFLRLRYAEAGGKTHEVKMAVAAALAHDAKVGAAIPVIYDPNHPDVVREPLTASVFAVEVGIVLLGLFLTVLGLGMGPVRIMKALAGNLRNAPMPATARKDWSEEAVGERLRAAAAQAAGAASSPAPWQSAASAAPAEMPVASPWATPGAEPRFGRASASSFGKRRA